MANELTITANLQINNPPLIESWPTSMQANQANGPVSHPDIVSIPTTSGGTLIPIGAVTSGQEGMVKFQNLDQANYCDLGLVVSATFYPFARLYPGSNGNAGLPALFPWAPSVAIYGRSNTAACKVRMVLAQS